MIKIIRNMRLLKLLTVFLYLSLFILSLVVPLQAAELITDFDSLINVEKSGRLTVVETISVFAEGRQIKRGIYRDFPTDYSDRTGHHVQVGFTILDILKDGLKEPYHIKKMSNGLRVYVGDKDVILEPGLYTYKITYQTDRQVGFFVDYDELYWNVTGNDWAFPIKKATATIILPVQTTIFQQSFYTGSMGSNENNAEVTRLTGDGISFQTTVPLGPRQGLTVAVAWPKGIVDEPDNLDRASYFFRDNLPAAIGGTGLLLLFVYYLLAWTRVGRDPEPGLIIPRFELPEGLTPAAARFVMRMKFDNKVFTAAVVNMAVKKFLTINEQDGNFSLKKSQGQGKLQLSAGERKVAGKIFSGSSSLELKRSNHRKISESIVVLKKSIEAEFGALHFKRNRKHLIPGLMISLLIVVAIVFTAHQKEVAGFMCIWLSGWTVGTTALMIQVYSSWKKVVTGISSIGEKGGALFSTLFALPFLGGWIFGATTLAMSTSFSGVLVLILTLSVNILFYQLLKAPTMRGRRLMDELEGIKLFLTIAEKDRLNLLNPPDKTPELFEKFLPWALALGVEQQWSEQFSEILTSTGEEKKYSPLWFNSTRNLSSQNFASDLGTSLSSTISSSSRSPGSSSGSSGGGSSGGGGGGGGGGGW